MDVYHRNGFKDRLEYLNYLADEYGIDTETIYHLADMLGPREDFDGLINALEDM